VRSEFETVEGPVWPTGSMRFAMRLFTEDGETVEQQLSLDRPGEGLLYSSEAQGPNGPIPGTTVNGEGVPVPYRFLDGGVTFDAAWPWQAGSSDPAMADVLIRDDLEGTVKFLVDPRPIEQRCDEGPAVASARALAQRLRSDPDLETTAPIAMDVGGVDALRMDVTTADGASFCEHPVNSPFVMSGAELAPGYGMRVYLLDLAGAPGRILAITIVAPSADFDRVVGSTAPIIDSLELHAP
jgi:hypothetical protein